MRPSLDQILLSIVVLIFSVLIIYDNGTANIKPQCADSGTCDESRSSASSSAESTSTVQDQPEPVTYTECIDRDDRCAKWADLGYCQKNHTRMLRECALSCDSCDDLNWTEDSEGCPSKYPSCEDCKDKLATCIRWKAAGECSKHPGYMVINCAKTCKYCHLQSNYSLRCPTNDAYMKQTCAFPEPGDLNKMFERIVSFYEEHKSAGDIAWELEILSRDPWILKFDHFFDEQEAAGIIEAAGKFERSTDVGQRDETGHFAKVTSTSRTSSNAWCHERCWNHPMVQQVMQRAERLMNISLDNSEHLQILEYRPGQYYKTHHDYIPTQVGMSCGPRILTWFMYLSDVEEGGATNFPRLSITNEPQLGRIILWPSVLDADPSQIDGRTYHEAQPVVKGVKYAANAWFHLYDFQTPNLWTCTG